jgi:hypothetical protein
MGFALTSSDEGTIVLLVFVGLIVVRRVFMMVQGTAVRPGRIVGVAVLFTALFVLVLASSYFQVPWWSFVLDGAVLVVAAIATTAYVREHVVFEWRNGQWYYKLHPIIIGAYLLLFVVRLAIDLVVLNINPVAPPTTGPMLTGTTLLLVAAVDALFGLSTGLLIGRSVGVYLEYEKKQKETPAPATWTPPPAPPAPGAPLP